uniref:Uncharacterized protein n=1 Tax=Alexandrium catenella TaxID=2925 RepID=A0A7S1S539_ALECA
MSCFRGVACCTSRSNDESEKPPKLFLTDLQRQSSKEAREPPARPTPRAAPRSARSTPRAARSTPHAAQPSPLGTERSRDCSPRAVVECMAASGQPSPLECGGSASTRGSSAHPGGSDDTEAQRAARPTSPKVLLARERLNASARKTASVMDVIRHWKKDTEVPVIEGFA